MQHLRDGVEVGYDVMDGHARVSGLFIEISTDLATWNSN